MRGVDRLLNRVGTFLASQYSFYGGAQVSGAQVSELAGKATSGVLLVVVPLGFRVFFPFRMVPIHV